jgi:lysophospholipase L1-like esterase
MPLGDSITDGYNIPGGYRIDLFPMLMTNGLTADFVGSLANGPQTLQDQQHEGHSGWRTDQIALSISGWLTTYQPQAVLLMIGTNDIIQSKPVAEASTDLANLIDQISVTRPTTHILVASIPPLAGATGDPNRNDRVIAYNATIPNIVSTRAAAGKKVRYVEMYNALTLSDLADGVHPNSQGYSKIANVWYNALVPVMTSP